MQALSQPRPRLLCSLVHKFGKRGIDDFEAFVEQLKSEPSPAVGELFIFVDECHRTQSGKLHRVMKALLPDAVLIGFTGTPLLKKDKATSLEVFGGYIHTYKFSEAVEDEVVLDLAYEARDIDQRLSSQIKVDQWFDSKTAELNPWQQRELKRQWGTLQNVLSSKSRMNALWPILSSTFGSTTPASQRGTPSWLPQASTKLADTSNCSRDRAQRQVCWFTSYDPKAADVTKEEVGANTETDKQFIYNTYTKLLEAIALNRA